MKKDKQDLEQLLKACDNMIASSEKTLTALKNAKESKKWEY